MITQHTFLFLKDLNANNNREWFAANKFRYDKAKQEVEEFVNLFIQKIALFDKSVAHLTAKNCVFRIYRDVRFSKDKSPYKTHFGAYITPSNKKTDVHADAGYYIHIEDGASMIAGGAYTPPADWLNAIRQEIDYNAEEFKKIINSKDFKTYFKQVEGERLSRPPKGYDAHHPDIELLKLKSFLATHMLSNKQVTDKDFVTYAAKVAKAMHPFNNFLNRAKD